MTIIRLVDGPTAYLHALIDNYSRRILSWTLKERLGSGGTCRILREAVVPLNDCPDHAIVVADAGSKDVNREVDNLLHGEEWTRIRAPGRGDPFEFNDRGFLAISKSLVALPVFHGQTPDEVFFGIGDEVIKKLAVARKTAHEKRMIENRAIRSGACRQGDKFGGVAIATAALQNVVRRSSATYRPSRKPRLYTYHPRLVDQIRVRLSGPGAPCL